MTPQLGDAELRIALLQTGAVPLDPEANLRTLRDAGRTARDAGSALLLTPELFLTGYAPAQLRSWMTPEILADLPTRVATIAREIGIAVVTSFPLARDDGSFGIAASLTDAAGSEVLRYEKVHLWGDEERTAFSAATAAPAVAEWRGRRVALQICYDIEFPEPARLIAERGADLVFVPTAIDGSSAYVPDVLVRARAAENAFVVAYADYPRTPGFTGEVRADFAGLSVVAGREGNVIAQAGTEAGILIADVPAAAELPLHAADYLRDRRPDRYADWRSDDPPRHTVL